MSIKPNKFFVVIIILGLMVNGCGTSDNQTQEVQTLANQIENTLEVQTLVARFLTETAEPTRTSLPTSAPFVMPTGNFQMSWNNYNNQYNTYTPAIITIYKQGLTYTEKEVMTDGSGGMMGITVTPQGTNLKIVEADMAGGDYMLISSSDGSLSYWDNQGLIYSVPLLTSTTQTPSASDYLTETANPTTTPSPASTPSLRSTLEKCVDSPG